MASRMLSAWMEDRLLAPPLAALTHGDDPAFQAFLARRAIDSLGYHRLRGLATRPWEQTLSETDCSELAAAELRRLGVDPGLLELPGEERSVG